ncbi:MAG: tagaturonate reductase [Bacteroidaceae bacterium]|nr:tagaturonate reductase [Bacteroidaceae bacterium]
MEKLNNTTYQKTRRPERIVQFGEGNFLRGFVEWIVQRMDLSGLFSSSVVIVKPRPGSLQRLLEQDCLYHVNLQGLSGGNVVDTVEPIDCVSRALSPYEDFAAFVRLASQPELRFVVSNTTEAGITFDPACRLTDTPAASFPAKLTQLLYHRFRAFGGDPHKGLILLPCELIPKNGQELTTCIRRYIKLWASDLGDDYRPFSRWFAEACFVCTTLVDRIVPGFPQKEAEALERRCGYSDKLLVQAEPFHLWVIEAPKHLPLQTLAQEFPAAEAGLNVLFTTDESPYHQRKVTLLNGPHTVLAPVAFLAGLDIVRDACKHPVVGRFVHRVMYEELLPTLDMPSDELRRFADAVVERFCNPFVDHRLTSIMLNSFPKYQTRDLPGLLRFVEQQGCLPQGLVLGLAAICVYYRGQQRADGTACVPDDDPRILELLTSLWQSHDARTVASGVLAAADLIWHEQGDLRQVPGLEDKLTATIESILQRGTLQTVAQLLES